jgi:hypothetical protein
MKQPLPILLLVCSAIAWAEQTPQTTASSPTAGSQPSAKSVSSATGKNELDKEAVQNADQAKAVIEQGIQALGGQAWLTMRDREIQGRIYGFHAGRPTGSGGLFWGFTQFPDKERIELTKERDIAELFVGNKAWEITYKGPHPIEQKDLDDYLRRRRFSLENVLRTWVNDPGVALIYVGNAIAAQHPAVEITLINSQDESVNLYFDVDTHLPVKKSFEWRDPVDRQKNLEEEIYENYRKVSEIMAPYNITRYFNGDMSSQRFLNSVTINQDLDQAMFDPNSGYNPMKPAKSAKH